MDRFDTDRLSVRHWRGALEGAARAELEADLAAILSPAVLAPLPPSLHWDGARESLPGWIEARAAESDVLLVTGRESGALLGLMILAPDPEAPEGPALHLGYLLAETAWGKGYASELVQGLVAARTGQGPLRLIGGVERSNPASARVLVKAGFAVDPALSDPGTEIYVRAVG